MDVKYRGGMNDHEWEKKANGKVTAVFKIEFHCNCEGCAKKFEKAARSLDGFEEVKADCAANKLTVTGKEDPTVMKKMLEKMKNIKNVELVSPQPREDDHGNKKPEEKSETEEEYEKPKESTVFLKIRLHCNGCVKELKKIVGNFNGVEKVDVADGKDLVTVKGTMDGKELAAYLSENLKRSVEIVAPKNHELGGDEKANIYSNGNKKEKDDDDLCLMEALALLWLRKKGFY